jgi:hypothetical protein
MSVSEGKHFVCKIHPLDYPSSQPVQEVACLRLLTQQTLDGGREVTTAQ